jgi:hypothetical protein
MTAEALMHATHRRGGTRVGRPGRELFDLVGNQHACEKITDQYRHSGELGPKRFTKGVVAQRGDSTPKVCVLGLAPLESCLGLSPTEHQLIRYWVAYGSLLVIDHYHCRIGALRPSN